MTQRLAEIASHFDGARQVNASQWEAKCPCHDDHHASLAIGEPNNDGKVLIYCHSGCSTGEVIAARGLKMTDLMPPQESQQKKKIVAEYDYRDENNRLLYQAIRYEPKDFRQRCPKEGGGWVWKLNGVQRVLYRLPQLAKADTAEPVFIVEGEKDADRLASIGLIATTNVGGASKGKTKWLPQYNESLRGRRVVIIPDNDEPGRAHANSIAKALQGIAANIKILALPCLPDKGDVSDWLNAGGTPEQLREFAATGEEWKPPAHEKQITTDLDDPNAVTNAFVEIDDDEKKTTVPLVMSDVLQRVRTATGNWPRRVDSSLFIDDSHGVNWLDSASALFGWLQARVGTIQWYKSLGCVGREEVYAELRRTSKRYLAVEEMPHEPLIDGHYYACQTPDPGNGETLQTLIDRFEPATQIDRDLIEAAMVTTVWGGHGGTRPCFVVTSDDGRGAGKSKLAEMIGHVAGGILSFSNNEEIGVIKTRLLSPAALTKRVGLLDNVKALKFSWAELEALITAPVISGKQMYVGEGSRPNTITWFITLNGASLSTDMAQRAIIIKVKRPNRAGSWEEDTLRFILDNRQRLIGDLIAFLRREPARLEKFSRWATWEKAVLSRLPEPSEVQAVITERQGAVDVDADEAESIEDFFSAQLRQFGYDPDVDRVFIPSSTAARWLNWATNENRNAVSAGRMLGQMITERRFRHIEQNRTLDRGRGVVWAGHKAYVQSTVWMDLLRRITEQKQGQGRFE